MISDVVSESPEKKKRSREEEEAEEAAVTPTTTDSTSKRRRIDRELTLLRSIPELQNYQRNSPSGRRGGLDVGSITGSQQLGALNQLLRSDVLSLKASETRAPTSIHKHVNHDHH